MTGRASRAWRTVTALSVAATGIAAAPVDLPPRTIVLLVADWCAPCRSELGRLDALVAAAAPYDLRVLLVDETAAGRRMMRDVPAALRWRAPPSIRDALLARTTGLPLSVAIGADGQPCGDVRGGATGERVRRLVDRCRATP